MLKFTSVDEILFVFKSAWLNLTDTDFSQIKYSDTGLALKVGFVLAGFISTALFIAYSFLSLAMPWSAEGEWVRQGYNQVFGISIRIAIASLVAFLIAEYQDVLSFFFFREKLKIKFFWLRSLLSNLWSQLLDSSIFMVIAFAGIYSNSTLISITISWWLYKVAMGALYTPLSYIGIYLLRGKNKEQAPIETKS